MLYRSVYMCYSMYCGRNTFFLAPWHRAKWCYIDITENRWRFQSGKFTSFQIKIKNLLRQFLRNGNNSMFMFVHLIHSSICEWCIANYISNVFLQMRENSISCFVILFWYLLCLYAILWRFVSNWIVIIAKLIYF